MSRGKGSDSRVFNALKNLGLELEAPQDEFSYQPDSSGRAGGAIGATEYGIDSDLDATGRGDENLGVVEDPTAPILGESEWSQNHRLPIDGAVDRETLESDSELIALVRKTIEDHGWETPTDLLITSSDRVVTLHGRIQSDEMKSQIGELVVELPGVSDLYNELTPNEGGAR